jgi:hypothetical protein
MDSKEDYILKLLYDLAANTPYRRGPSYVPGYIEFQPTFPPAQAKTFLADPILQIKHQWQPNKKIHRL